MTSAGQRFRQALKNNKPLQIVGTVNAYCAIMAKAAGHEAIYISGGALAAISCGIPDLGITNLEDVLTDVRRITDVVDTPLIVDIDTGFGGAFGIQRTIKSLIKFGAAGVHLEDQVAQKRCGHRPNKQLVSTEEMSDRIIAAHEARQQTDPDFYLIARTDAFASEGLEAAVERAKAYQAAGADAIFAEAVLTLEDYKAFSNAIDIPILANITEFGATPFFTTDELAGAGVAMVLYPFAATRMMNQAAMTTYETLKKEGTQSSLIDQMQTREQLYHYLGYHEYEDQLDQLFSKQDK